MLEAVGFPVAVNPETRLAAIARKRGWLVEHWAKATRGGRPFPMAPMMVERERRRRSSETPAAWFPRQHHLRRLRSAQRWGRGEGALQMRAVGARLGLARIASAIGPSAAVRVGPLEYRTVDPPELPGEDGTASAPACRDLRVRPVDDRGSRLDVLRRRRVVPVRARATRSSASLDDGRGSPSSRCSVTPPVASRLPFAGAAPATATTTATSRRVTSSPGIQTGFCSRPEAAGRPSSSPTRASCTASTTHRRASRAHRAARRRHPRRAPRRQRRVGSTRADAPIVAVLGAGTMGLAAIAGLVRYVPDASVVVGARYPHQQREARRSAPTTSSRPTS